LIRDFALVLGGVMVADDSAPVEQFPDLRQYVESPEARAQEASEAVARMSETATEMLSQLNMLEAAELTVIQDCLSGPLERMYQATKYQRTSRVWPLAVFAAYIAVPAMLLRWSASKHSPIGYGVLYVATLFFGMLAGIIIFIFIAMMSGTGSFYVTSSTSESDGVKEKSLRISRLFTPKRDILWAWSEINESDKLREQARNRKRAQYRSAAGAAALLLTAAGALIGLQLTVSTIAEIACISFLIPIFAGAIAILTEISGRISRPRTARLSDSLGPGDATLIDMVNLAFLTNHRRLKWNNSNTVTRLLAEFESAARMAEYAFPGRSALILLKDADTTAWARDQSVRLAAGLRRHKRAILLAHGPGSLDEVTQSLCSGLSSASQGNWNELTRFPGLPAGQTRLKRLARFVAPPALLIAAAVFIPILAGTAAERDTIRASLIVAAILALITALSPESAEAATTIRGAFDKMNPFR
jgi:hypothetical protein